MNENPGLTHDVYLSYAPQDKTWADAACAMLERQRIRCWVASRDIAPGDERNAAIMKAINQSQIMVVIFSTHANASGQVHREVERACNRGMTVLPIRIEDVQPEGAMKFSLHNKHWLEACTPPVKRHLEKVAQTVKAFLGQDVDPVADPAVDDPPNESPDGSPVTVGPHRPRAFWPAVIAGSLFGVAALATIVALLGKPGRDAKENVPDNTPILAGNSPRNVEIKSPVNNRAGVPVPIRSPSAPRKAVSPPVVKPHRPPAESVGASEFVPLFNGKDLSGWRVAGNTQHTWKVLPGGILEGSGPPPFSRLETERADFSDFHLRLETQIASGPNSEIAFRMTESNGESLGYWAHISGTNQDENNTGCLKFVGFTLAEADPVVPIRPGEWFTEEVIADGDVITVIVKGIEVVKFKVRGRKLVSGAIDLLCRGNSKVLFRKMEIKRLDRAGGDGSPASIGGSGKAPIPIEWGRMARVWGKAEWRVDGDELVCATPASGTVSFGDPTWTNYTFSAEVKIVQSTDNAGLIFRDGGEQPTGRYSYNGGLRGVYGGAIASSGKGNIPARRTGNTTLARGRWHKMRINVQGNRLTAYLDDSVVMAATDSAKTRGCVGFSSAKSICRFRNVKVTAPDGTTLWEGLPEIPTAGSFGVSLKGAPAGESRGHQGGVSPGVPPVFRGKP